MRSNAAPIPASGVRSWDRYFDYAANAVVYWPVDKLRARFETNRESEQYISDLLENPDADPEEFWQKVETNSRAGKVRLIFVSDRIPNELRCIVEFLNEQMNPAEVLAVEVKQYVSQDSSSKILVPRIIGQTAKAQDNKFGGGRDRVDEKIFFEELETKQGSDAAATIRKVQEWAQDKTQDKMPRSAWQRNGRHAVFYPCLDHKGVPYFPVRFGADGRVGVVFMWLNAGKPPFGDERKREELLHRLNEIPGVAIPADRINGVPAFALSTLGDEAALTKFLEVFDWFVQEVKAT